MRRTTLSRAATWLALATATSVAIVGCGGSEAGGDEAAPRSTTSTTTTVPAAGRRPEGRWTFVLTTGARDDAPDLEPGTAEVRLIELTPTCDAGPCDLDITPAGAKGTYLPEGVAARETPRSEPGTFVWDDGAETYTRVTGPRKTSCTNAEGTVVPDAYTQTTTTTVQYRPATGDGPATLVGTYRTEVEAAAEGADGCTPFVETGTAVAAPTGSLDGDAAPDLAGSYVATEVVTRVEPAGQRPPGFVGMLGPFELRADGEGYRAKGVIGEAALEPAGAGFSGRTDEVERPCATTPETPKGFTSIEELTDLAAVALTEDGEPILAGSWSLSEEPTPAGVDAGCSTSSNTGYLVLVPAGSLD